MYVPTLPTEPPLDENGDFVQSWKDFFQIMITNMQIALSDEGFEIPNQNTSNIALINPSATKGTLIFDESAINGGSSAEPNGQLFVKLADGSFHPVTNT